MPTSSLQTFEFQHSGRTLTIEPEAWLVRMNFGKPTDSLAESTALAEWIAATLNQIIAEQPAEKLFVIADVSELDDSTMPSEQAKQTYEKILQTKQLDEIAYVSPSYGMKMILDILFRSSGQSNKVSTVATQDQAKQLYTNWLSQQHL